MGRNPLDSRYSTPTVSTPYLAGLIDADGCVRVTGTSQYVSLTNRYLPVLTDIQEIYGGNVRIDGNVYRLELHGKNARGILREILPYLREKKEQARLTLLWSDFPPRSRMREAIEQRVKDLKQTCYVGKENL